MRKNMLVVYYSHSGNTRKIAELIREQVDGDLYAIEPETAYPVSYDAVVKQAKKEIQAGFHPRLKTPAPAVAQYDAVFVGTPNWWSTLAPPIAAFLSEHDFAGRIVIPFCTHGGGGGGRVEKDLAGLCSGATVLPGLVLSGDGGAQAAMRIAAWLKRVTGEK